MAMTAWVGIAAGCVVLGIFWILYLIKVVVRDEQIQERQRVLRRRKEEERRAVEDRYIARQREAQEALRALSSNAPPPEPEAPAAEEGAEG
jgi:hypothetical protein